MPTRFQSNKSVKEALNSAAKEIGNSIKNGTDGAWTKIKRGTAGRRDSVLQKFGVVNLRTAPKIGYAIREAACAVELKKFVSYNRDYKRFVKICSTIDNDLSNNNNTDALLPTTEQIDKKIQEIENQIKDKEKEIKSKGGTIDSKEEKRERTKRRKGGGKKTRENQIIDDLKEEIDDLEEELKAFEKLKKGGAVKGKKLIEDFRAAIKPLGKLGTKFTNHKSKIKKYKSNLDAKREEISGVTDEGNASRISKSLDNFSKSFYIIHKDKFFTEYEKIADKVFDSIIELKKAVEANDNKKLMKARDYFHLVSIQKELFAVGDAKKEYAELDQFTKTQIRFLNKKTWKIFRKTEDST